MLMLLLLTQNHHVKTDAHSLPMPYKWQHEAELLSEANPKLYSLSQCTSPFFPLCNTLSELHPTCYAFMVEKSCFSGVFLKIYFFLQ